MIITRNILFKNFSKKDSSSVNNKLRLLLSENNETLNILDTRKLPKYIQNNLSLYSKWLET